MEYLQLSASSTPVAVVAYGLLAFAIFLLLAVSVCARRVTRAREEQT